MITRNKHFVGANLRSFDASFYLATMVAFYNMIIETTAEALNLTEFMTDFKKKLDLLQDYVGRSFKLILSKDLKEKDDLRDKIYTFIYQSIQTFLKSPDTAKKAAAEALSYAMSTYYNKRTITFAYDKESSQINGFLLDANKPENLAHFTTLGLAAELPRLKAAQDDFQTTFDSRTVVKQELYTNKTIELRQEIDIYYQRMTEQIFAANILASTQVLSNFMDRWNYRLHEFKNEIAGTGSTKKSDSDKPKDDGTLPAEETPADGTSGSEDLPKE